MLSGHGSKLVGSVSSRKQQDKKSLRMKVALLVDHFVSDSAEAAQFMQALAKYLEEPLRLLV